MSQKTDLSFEGRGASETEMERTGLSPGQKAGLFGAAYFACAQGSMLLTIKGSPDISFWLPSGLYVAVLLLNDCKLWPLLVLAAAVANVAFDMTIGVPAMSVPVFVCANAAQAVAGA